MQISRFHQKMLTFNKDFQPALSSFKEKFMLICLDAKYALTLSVQSGEESS